MRRVCVIVITTMLFGVPITLKNAVGVALAMLGMIAFLCSKNHGAIAARSYGHRRDPDEDFDKLRVV